MMKWLFIKRQIQPSTKNEVRKRQENEEKIQGRELDASYKDVAVYEGLD